MNFLNKFSASRDFEKKYLALRNFVKKNFSFGKLKKKNFFWSLLETLIDLCFEVSEKNYCGLTEFFFLSEWARNHDILILGPQLPKKHFFGHLPKHVDRLMLRGVRKKLSLVALFFSRWYFFPRRSKYVQFRIEAPQSPQGFFSLNPEILLPILSYMYPKKRLLNFFSLVL